MNIILFLKLSYVFSLNRPIFTRNKRNNNYETTTMKQQIIECVPNISEGKDLKKINTIANVVTEVEGIKLLDIDLEKPRTEL